MTKEKKSIILRYFSHRKAKRYFLFVFFIMEFIHYYISNQFALLPWHDQVKSLGIKTPMRRDQEIDNLPRSTRHGEMIKSIHNYSNSRSDVFDMNGDIRLHSNSDIIFVDLNMSRSWRVRSYARKSAKDDKYWNIHASKNTTEFPNCHRHFNTPAILFSSGSYAGNYYHSFADVLFPLYITSRPFNRTVLLLVSNYQPWLLRKFKMIMDKLTNYEIVDIDKESEVLCFSRLIVGLKADKELVADSNTSPNYSINDFRQLLRETYSLKRKTICNKKYGTKRPRVLIVSRINNRRLINEEKVAKMASNMGAIVSVKGIGWDVSSSARYVNSFDVFIAVHGAGITNMLFLPDDAVLVQIVPFSLDYVSRVYYAEPAREMELRYLEYKVSLNESSLLGKYPPNSEIYTNPDAVYMKRGYALCKSIYLDNQDVTLDLGRFWATLSEALRLVQCDHKHLVGLLRP